MHVYRLRSPLDPKIVCSELEGLDAIAINTAAVRSVEELELAIYLAKRSFGKKTNIGRKLKYEFLLWLAGKTDIRSAMEATTPKEKEDFFAVIFSDSGENEVIGRLKAEELPLGLETHGQPLDLEKISLSRVKG